MNRNALESYKEMTSVPRASGDEPPLTGRPTGGVNVFPARAGMNRLADRRYSRCSRVPRASGDEPTY